MTGRLSEVEESVFKERDEAFEQLGQPMEEGEHVNWLQCIWCSDGVKLKTDGVFDQYRTSAIP